MKKKHQNSNWNRIFFFKTQSNGVGFVSTWNWFAMLYDVVLAKRAHSFQISTKEWEPTRVVCTKKTQNSFPACEVYMWSKRRRINNIMTEMCSETKRDTADGRKKGKRLEEVTQHWWWWWERIQITHLNLHSQDEQMPSCAALTRAQTKLYKKEQQQQRKNWSRTVCVYAQIDYEIFRNLHWTYQLHAYCRRTASASCIHTEDWGHFELTVLRWKISLHSKERTIW